MKKIFQVFQILTLLGGYHLVIGQEVEENKTLTESYERGDKKHEQVTNSLKAYSKVGKSANVHYEAGKSVVLLPGFVAQSGSTFKANIARIESKALGEKLTLRLATYPNPFNEGTEVEYSLPQATNVTLTMTNAAGQQIAVLLNKEYQQEGTYKVKCALPGLSEGSYQFTLQTDQEVKSAKTIKKQQ
jgi:Secretion system C-terminal sorting domain